MSTIPTSPLAFGADLKRDYPTGDGKPVGETPIHRDNLLDGVRTLQLYFADDPMVYVSGNMFVYYEEGNPRKHVSPDVFVAFGVPKHNADEVRDAYFVWLEPRGPSVVIELTSKSTRNEDLKKKMAIYRDIMSVPEYFLFDPKGEYLMPSLQGYRLHGGVYVPIESVAGRLPSEELGLELERNGEWLRFYDPATGCWVPTQEEQMLAAGAQCSHAEAKLEQAEAKLEQAEAKLEQAEAKLEQAEAERARAKAEAASLRQELERLQRRLSANTPPTDNS